MASEKQNQQNSEQTFTRKVWITVGIVTLAVILLMLFRALFDLFLLVFAGIMIAIFFHGFGGVIQRYLHLPRKLSLVISVVFSLLLAVGFAGLWAIVCKTKYLSCTTVCLPPFRMQKIN